MALVAGSFGREGKGEFIGRFNLGGHIGHFVLPLTPVNGNPPQAAGEQTQRPAEGGIFAKPIQLYLKVVGGHNHNRHIPPRGMGGGDEHKFGFSRPLANNFPAQNAKNGGREP